MKNSNDQFEKMCKCLLSDLARAIVYEPSVTTMTACRELLEILDGDDENALDEIRAYFNCLNWVNPNRLNEVLGPEQVNEIFSKTVEKYPELTRVLTSFVYA